MSRLSLERGASVVVWDINAQALTDTVAELSRTGSIVGYRADLSDCEQITQTARKTIAEVGMIDILINNAGVVTGDFFHAHEPEDIAQTVAVNMLAPMYLTRIFLRDAIARKSGHVCNIASMASLISNPKMSVYAASKWAITGWSDSLRLEMTRLKTQVKVTTVLPYYINTGMFDGVRSLIPLLDQEKVALKIIRAIERDRIFLDMPCSHRLVRLMQGLLPVRWFDLVAGEWLGIYRTMEHFTGRKTN
jgi:short-subunit dehydrogenase